MLESLKHEVRALLAQGKDEKAYGLLGQILAQYSADAEAYYLLSIIAHKYKSYDKEIEVLRQAERLAPDNTAYRVYLARAMAIAGASSLAWENIKAIDVEQLDTADLVDALAVTFNRLSLYNRARQAYERLIALDDTNAYTWFNLGTCSKYCGRFQEAHQAFTQAIRLKPDYYKARAAVSALGFIASSDDVIPELQNLLGKAGDTEERLHLAHALSREFEARGDYHRSFEVLAAHKEPMRRSLAYDVSKDERIFSAIGSGESVGGVPDVASLRNLFVVGMPRSGTTLVERILSSVPNVVSGGELYHFSRALQRATRQTSPSFVTPGAVSCRDQKALEETGRIYRTETAYLCGEGQILLDKLPLNVLYTSQILSALEGALVICLERNPLDTITGNYRQLFSFDDGAHGYSLSLSDTARYYAHFNAVIRWFERIYPRRFHVVNYERLVSQPQEEVKRLLEFCGFAWNPSYLAVENNPQPVATASAVQVRDKINARAVGRWKRYEPFLCDAKRILSENGVSWDELSRID